MVYAADKLIGVGVYTPAEAAFYAGVHPALMGRWVHGTRSHEAAIRPQLADKQERIVTFWDFIQAMTIRELRLEHGVPLGRIRQAVERAHEMYGIEYPFARPHTTFVFRKQVYIQLRDIGMVQVTGKQPRQLVMKKLLEKFLKHVSFDESGLAREYLAYEYRGHRIVMNPKRQFGEPVVESCRYPARVLWEAYDSEGGLNQAAESFGVTMEQIQAACKYRERLDSMAN